MVAVVQLGLFGTAFVAATFDFQDMANGYKFAGGGLPLLSGRGSKYRIPFPCPAAFANTIGLKRFAF